MRPTPHHARILTRCCHTRLLRSYRTTDRAPSKEIWATTPKTGTGNRRCRFSITPWLLCQFCSFTSAKPRKPGALGIASNFGYDDRFLVFYQPVIYIGLAVPEDALDPINDGMTRILVSVAMRPPLTSSITQSSHNDRERSSFVGHQAGPRARQVHVDIQDQEPVRENVEVDVKVVVFNKPQPVQPGLGRR